MTVTINFDDRRLSGSISPISGAAGRQPPGGEGLLISPETSTPTRGRSLVSFTLAMIGLGLVASTLVFVSALIAVALS